MGQSSSCPNPDINDVHAIPSLPQSETTGQELQCKTAHTLFGYGGTQYNSRTQMVKRGVTQVVQGDLGYIVSKDIHFI